MGCGSSSTADPKSGKPQNLTSTREQENRVNSTKSRVNDRYVPNSHRTQTKQPVQNSTVNDRDVPNSHTAQSKQPVQKSTVNDRDVPNSHTIQSKQPVQTSTVNDRDVPKSIITQTKQPVQTSTVNERDVPKSIITQTKQPVQTSTVNDRDVPKSIIAQTRQSVQKSTIDRENKVKTQKPRDLKLNFEYFQQIDEHARKAPSSVEESVDTLANYLAKPAKNDLEKVRALYVWICENIRYNTDAFFGGNLSSAATKGKDVLKCKSSVCAGYASLFEALCLSLGITCKKISGYAKGYRHKAGDVISYEKKTNHAWNVVELDGTWQFIETTWGAGYVDKNKKFNKQFNNFCFLTPPQSFITDHFPYINNNIEESKQWQLLDNPLTLEVYSKSIKPSKEARHFGIEFPSHPYEMITVENSCTITVESKADVLLKIWYDLFDDHGSPCNESVIVLKEKNCKYKVNVRPKHKGRFELHVNATIDKCDSNTRLVAYIIDCVSVESDFKAYPTNRGYYGPKRDYIQRGFHMPDVVQPFHMCKNGEFEIEVKTTATPEITTTMFDGDGTDQKDYTLVEQTDDTIYIRARFTKKGYYKLTIFSKFGEPQKFTEALILLIFNSNQSETTSAFPLTYTTTRKYKCRLLEPLVRDIPANSEIQFQFTSKEFTNLLVNKKVHAKENGDVWRIVTETGESGSLNLSGKPSDGSSYWPVYGFVIKS